MPSSQGAAGSSKNIKSDAKGRRGSCSMILLGIALLIGALVLYLYYKSNLPQIREAPREINNINRATQNTRTETPGPTPSSTASP